MLAKLFNDFIFCGVLGWIYECIYCTIRTGHWQNRGFLFGPSCPIYGTGAVLTFALALYLPGISTGEIPLWKLYLLFMAGSAVLEYSVSWGLERLFHARWWDYSGMPLNLNGRICLPASAFFGFAGLFILRCLLPLSRMAHSALNAAVDESCAMAMMFIFGADVALSVASMSALLETLERMEASVDAKMENGVQIARQIPMKVSEASDKARDTVADASDRARNSMAAISGHAKDAVVDHLQRHHLDNIRRFVSKKHTNAADQIRRVLRGKGSNDRKEDDR